LEAVVMDRMGMLAVAGTLALAACTEAASSPDIPSSGVAVVSSVTPCPPDPGSPTSVKLWIYFTIHTEEDFDLAVPCDSRAEERMAKLKPGVRFYYELDPTNPPNVVRRLKIPAPSPPPSPSCSGCCCQSPR